MIPVSFHCRFVALIILVLVLVLIPVHSREGFGIEKGKRIEEDVLDYYEEEGDSRNDTDHEAANANPPDSSEEDDGSDSTDDSNIKIEGEGFQINYILIGGAVLLQFVGAVIFVYVRIFKWERWFGPDDAEYRREGNVVRIGASDGDTLSSRDDDFGVSVSPLAEEEIHDEEGEEMTEIDDVELSCKIIEECGKPDDEEHSLPFSGTNSSATPRLDALRGLIPFGGAQRNGLSPEGNADCQDDELDDEVMLQMEPDFDVEEGQTTQEERAAMIREWKSEEGEGVTEEAHIGKGVTEEEPNDVSEVIDGQEQSGGDKKQPSDEICEILEPVREVTHTQESTPLPEQRILECEEKSTGAEVTEGAEQEGCAPTFCDDNNENNGVEDEEDDEEDLLELEGFDMDEANASGSLYESDE